MSDSKSGSEQANLLESSAGESDSSNCDFEDNAAVNDGRNCDFEDNAGVSDSHNCDSEDSAGESDGRNWDSEDSVGESDGHGCDFEDSAGESDVSSCDFENNFEENYSSGNDDFEISSEDTAVYSDDNSNIEPDPLPPDFPFLGTPGSKFLLEDKFDVLAYFRLFFDDSVVDILVSETNKYAAQQQSKAGSQWKHVDKNEIMIFLAITMLKGLIKKPEEKAYWSTNEIWCTPIFPKLMSLQRYKSIKRNFHFCNIETLRKTHSPHATLHEIWPIYKIINDKCSSLYIPEKEIVIEESLTLYKDPLDWFEYTPKPRLKFGTKLYFLYEEGSNYIFSFDICSGTYPSIFNRYKETLSYCRMVSYLLKPLLEKGYFLTLNEYYYTPELENYLLRHKTVVLLAENKDNEKPKFTPIRKLENYEKMKKHNKTPGGVDLPYEPHEPKKICYKSLFFNILYITIWNAHILYKKNGGENDELGFRKELVERIIENYHTQTDIEEKSDGILRLTERHFPSFVPPTPEKEAPTRYCAVCFAKRDSNGKRMQNESRYMCNNCNVGLCAAPCFEIYHTNKDFK